MTMQLAINGIVERLRQGRYPNEQAISQGIVLPVLRELGWDIFDTSTVWPEYQTGEGRADFALCCPPSKPAALIEVKANGKAEDGVRQALEYAFHTGAPLIVLTDGRTWSFYLPAEKGTYEDRRVYKLDLFERTVVEAADKLIHYLDRQRVESGAAIDDAREECKSRNRRSEAREAIPKAWRELAQRDPTFLERCSHHPNAQGSKRRYIARTAEELYPDREDHREMCEPIIDDWLVTTNVSNWKKMSIIKLACDVAGLKLGQDVVVDL
jgi:hypothetical protein